MSYNSIDDISIELYSKKSNEELPNNCWWSKVIDNKSKFCLVTLVDNGFTKYSDQGPIFFYTHQQFIKYCNKYQLDYIVIVANLDYNTMFSELCYQKFNVKHMTQNYDRVLLVDVDVFIRDKAQNIFEYANNTESVYMFDQKFVSDICQDYYKRFLETYKKCYLEKFGTEPVIPEIDKYNNDNPQTFYNTGIIVFTPNLHNCLFNDPEIEIMEPSLYPEQCYLNLRIFQHNLMSVDLNSNFGGIIGPNFFEEKNIALYDVCDFIHFAGRSQKYTKLQRLTDFMLYEKINKKYKPKKILFFKHNMTITREPFDKLRRSPEESYNDESNCLHRIYSGFVHFYKKSLPQKDINKIVELYPGDYRLTKFFSRLTNEIITIDETETTVNDNILSLPNLTKIIGSPHTKTNIVEDESVDIVYINNRIFDYYDWSSLLTQWFQKLRFGGLLCGSGYVYNYAKKTLIKAIIERFSSVDILYDDGTWIIQKTRQNQIPLVSIIIPVYNSEDWLEDCLISVHNQTFQNYEIIIIDDFSTDNSVEKIDSLKHLFGSKLRFIKNPTNKGPAYCRNLGVDISLGEFILPVDSDNILEQNFLETCVHVMKETEADIVYTNLKYFELKNDVWITPDEFDINQITKINCLDNCSLFRKRIFKKVRFDESLDGFIDWDFWIQCKKYGFKFVKNPHSFFNYRYRSRSVRDLAKENSRNLKEKILSKITVSSKVITSTDYNKAESKIAKSIIEKIRTQNLHKQI